MNKNVLSFYGMLTLVILLFVYQIVDYTLFRTKGPRFTALDGQALCERVQQLEKVPQPCEYAP